MDDEDQPVDTARMIADDRRDAGSDPREPEIASPVVGPVDQQEPMVVGAGSDEGEEVDDVGREHGSATRLSTLPQSVVGRAVLGARGIAGKDPLEAAYAYGLVQGHPYVDGNKRVGLVAMVAFLDLNGVEFVATDAESVDCMLRVASGRMNEAEPAEWIRTRIASS